MFLLTNFLEIISNTVLLSGYISGNNVFPLPLDEEEEKFYLEKLKEGDKLAKETIVNGNLKLVLSLVQKYNNGKCDMNDLFQMGCIGLIKAVDNFDLSFNVQFSTYAVPMCPLRLSAHESHYPVYIPRFFRHQYVRYTAFP